MSNVRKRYHQHQYDYIVEILQDQPRLGRPITFDHKVEANVAMIACSEAPQGSARWTLNLIADKLVQLQVVDSISHESVRSLLKKTNLSLG
jgi:putative transposase